MTPSDEAALKEFLSADEKRTPGEWLGTTSNFTGPRVVAKREPKASFRLANVGELFDARFIASASRIAQPIRALMENVRAIRHRAHETESSYWQVIASLLDRAAETDAELAALTSRNRQLAEALEKYGRHSADCVQHHSMTAASPQHPYKCVCGLDDALAAQGQIGAVADESELLE